MIGGIHNIRAGGFPANSVKFALLAWFVSEVIAFALAVKLLGFGLTLLLCFASSILGVVILRRIGLDAARHLRQTVAGGRAESGAVLDGTLTAFGAMLLILPGFVSDAAGLALATPSIRQAIAARFLVPPGAGPSRQTARRAQPDVIDLSPDDWRVVDRSSRG